MGGSGYKVLIKYIFDDDEKNLGLYFLYIVIWNVTMYNNNNNIRYREHPLNRVANTTATSCLSTPPTSRY